MVRNSGNRMLAVMAATMICLFAGFTSAAAYTVNGVLTNEAGSPVNGALVTLSPGGISTFSNTDGYYVISNVEPREYTMRVSAAGYETQEMTLNVTGDVRRDFVLTTERVELRGLVVDEDGAAINGAAVVLSPGGISTFSNSDGFYSIPNLEPKTYNVRVSAPGFETYETTMSITSNMTHTFTLERTTPASAQLSGIISSTDGSIINGATIRLSPGGISSFSNTDGYYTITGIDEGTYTMQVSAPGYVPYEDQITLAGTMTRNVVLTPLSATTGGME